MTPLSKRAREFGSRRPYAAVNLLVGALVLANLLIWRLW